MLSLTAIIRLEDNGKASS